MPRFPVDCNATVITLVRALHERSRPTAVAWFVVAVVVYTIKRAAFGALPHVGEEVFELLPSLADRNTPTTVERIPAMRFPVATSTHLYPSVVGSRANERVGLSTP